MAEFTSFVSCDPRYFETHAPALVSSALFHGNNLHVHVVGHPTRCIEVIDALEPKATKMKRNIESRAQIHFSMQDNIILPARWHGDTRTYYACNRFLEAPSYMVAMNTSVLILDVDCFFMQPIVEPNHDVSLFLREPMQGVSEWETQGSRVAAGAVYFNFRALRFAEFVRERLRTIPVQWFMDQVALNQAYQHFLPTGMNFGTFDSTFMDWEFVANTAIWTGKGPRKDENQTYLTQKAQWEDLLWRMSQ